MERLLKLAAAVAAPAGAVIEQWKEQGDFNAISTVQSTLSETEEKHLNCWSADAWSIMIQLYYSILLKQRRLGAWL